jgi:phosphate transport system substrate-binding protein
LRVIASATLAPLANELGERVRQADTPIQLRIAGSENALEALAAGQADVALVARALTAKEAALFDSRTIGYDSLLIIAHARNKLAGIDRDTLRGIFSRQLSDWSQIGAGDSGAIVPVTRGQGNGTRTVLERAFDIGSVVPAGMVELGSNLAVTLYVAADPQAIGYVSAGAYSRARQRGLGIKALPLDGITPDAAFCVGSKYPLCRPLILVKRRHLEQRRTAARIDALLAGDDGIDLLVRHGFAPPASR